MIMSTHRFPLGIEIGGTKLQVGIGGSSGKLLPRGVLRKRVAPEDGAEGIRRDLIAMTEKLLERKRLDLADISRVGIAFGGVLDSKRGVILKSFQIKGWDNFPLKAWAEKQWNKPVFVENDASAAALAEALHGNGRGYKRIFYITIGSGIGGGWIADGKIDQGQGLGAAEIGHIWIPDPTTGNPVELEQVCSGWSIGRRAREAASRHRTLMTKLAGKRDRIDSRIVHQAAKMGDKIANRILQETCEVLGTAISNVIALLHPERVIIGGGVSLMGRVFWKKLRQEVKKRTMPSFSSSVEVLPARLKENVAVIGALCLGQ